MTPQEQFVNALLTAIRVATLHNVGRSTIQRLIALGLKEAWARQIVAQSDDEFAPVFLEINNEMASEALEAMTAGDYDSPFVDLPEE